MRLWYLSHRRPAKAQAAHSRQSLRCSQTSSKEVDNGSDQKSDIQPHSMAAPARLKNEFTEDEKYHVVSIINWYRSKSRVEICFGTKTFSITC